VILGGLYFVVMYSISSALIYVSYPTQLVFSNLRLFTIFIIAKFFSRKEESAKGEANSKLLIGTFITVGIILFNYEVSL
jgi:membrane protein implicated in regulation of membrane protease activity